MSGSRIGHTECLSRRGFLKLCSASSAALALTVYTRQPPSSPALPVLVLLQHALSCTACFCQLCQSHSLFHRKILLSELFRDPSVWMN